MINKSKVIESYNRCLEYSQRNTLHSQIQLPKNRIIVFEGSLISDDELILKIDKYDKKTKTRMINNEQDTQPMLQIKNKKFKSSSFFNIEGEEILNSFLTIKNEKISGKIYLNDIQEEVIATFSNIVGNIGDCILIEYYNKITGKDEKLTAVRNMELCNICIYQGSIVEEEDPPLIAKFEIENQVKYDTCALNVRISPGVDSIFIISIFNSIYNTLVKEKKKRDPFFDFHNKRDLCQLMFIVVYAALLPIMF